MVRGLEVGAYTSPGKKNFPGYLPWLLFYGFAHKNLKTYKGFGTEFLGKRSKFYTLRHETVIMTWRKRKLYVLTKTKCPAVLVENLFQG